MFTPPQHILHDLVSFSLRDALFRILPNAPQLCIDCSHDYSSTLARDFKIDARNLRRVLDMNGTEIDTFSEIYRLPANDETVRHAR